MSFTHFAPNPQPEGCKGFWMYSLDTCEQCDREVQAVNGVTVLSKTRQELEAIGMKFDEKARSELSCDEDGCAICEDCQAENAKRMVGTGT